jgi:REase_MTES_1575/Transcriptional regulator, AbiEi antitoxin
MSASPHDPAESSAKFPERLFHPAEAPLADAPAESPARALLLGIPFTTAEASAVGISRKVLRRMVDQGLLRRPLKGVFVDSAQPDSVLLRVRAAGKVVPAGSVVCDRTALWVHAAEVMGPDGRYEFPPIDVFRLAGRTRVRRPQCQGGTRTLQPRDVMEIDGVLVTTQLRTALDLGRLSRREDAFAALDALMRVGGFAVSDLVAELPRFRGARGVRQLRQLVPWADGRSESPAESLTRLQLLDAGLPAPAVQYEMCNVAGVLIYRIDLAYPDILLAIEYDGREYHTADDDRAHDRRRREYLRRLGWTFVVLTADDVYGRDPQAGVTVRRERERLLAAAAA